MLLAKGLHPARRSPTDTYSLQNDETEYARWTYRKSTPQLGLLLGSSLLPAASVRIDGERHRQYRRLPPR